ncbi:MAG: hypothetical protein MjAS7_2502 [Metallosphaera javensis (ex Sakai et al. 2022)]|nr:MAG: hypothetical protein MjAS7_2502 [Metallosphaera javensis (ex Sakai et al. 2022)]
MRCHMVNFVDLNLMSSFHMGATPYCCVFKDPSVSNNIAIIDKI